MPTILEKAPPHNVESEKYVLGAVLYDSSCLPAVSEILSGNSFYFERHREIFDCYIDLYQLGEPIDAANVVSRLEHKGLGKDGDLSFLLDLEDSLLSPGKATVNGVACAKLVRRCALDRKRRELAQKVIEKPGIDIKDDLGKIDEELAKLDGQKSDPWIIYTPEDAFTERQPLQYNIERLFIRGSLNLLFGPPAGLKTFWLLDSLICNAAGIPFLNRSVFPCPTMLIDFDNGARRSHERVEALLRGHNLTDKIPFFYTSMPSPWLNAGNLRDIDALVQRVNDRSVKSIGVDNLGLISGNADENSAEMIQVMGNLRLLAERTGAAVTVIHHERKSNGIGGRAGDAVRGHSSIEAALDLALQVEREQRSNVITIKSTKTRDVDVLPFGAEFCFEQKPNTGELASAVFRPYEIEDNLSENAIESTIRDVLAASPLLKQAELVEKVKGQGIDAGKNRIGPIANRMASKGLIAVNLGPKGAKLYSLT